MILEEIESFLLETYDKILHTKERLKLHILVLKLECMMYLMLCKREGIETLMLETLH